MVHMMLCPNCRTIQREGVNCPLCACPVSPNYTLPPDVGQAKYVTKDSSSTAKRPSRIAEAPPQLG